VNEEILYKYILPLSFSFLIGVVVTFALFLGFKEWKISKANKALKQQKLISLSTIIPNILIYMVVAPYWHWLYFYMQQYAFFQIQSIIISIPLALILCDFSYYWEHRTAHKVTTLWKLYHGTHHTGISYNIPLAYRVNGLNMLVAPLFYLPWLLLGFHPLIILGFQLFVFHYQGWLHTNLIGRIPAMDKWFNTPANHRMHHCNDPQHKDVNFAAVFMLWDHLFGTYKSPEDNLHYGIKGRDSDDSFIGVYTDL
jgi:sterol desaturase/sphingolipid hydroxylase (fatty acid hydroxylase superfamily)